MTRRGIAALGVRESRASSATRVGTCSGKVMPRDLTDPLRVERAGSGRASPSPSATSAQSPVKAIERATLMTRLPSTMNADRIRPCGRRRPSSPDEQSDASVVPREGRLAPPGGPARASPRASKAPVEGHEEAPAHGVVDVPEAGDHVGHARGEEGPAEAQGAFEPRDLVRPRCGRRRARPRACAGSARRVSSWR